MHALTHIPSIVAHAAQIPKSPTGHLWCVGYTRCICLEKVDFVDRISVDCACEKSEEDEEDGAGYQDK